MVDTEEVKKNAAHLARRGYGILAADESVGTIGKRLVAQGLTNDEETRRKFREILLTSPGLEEAISGVILFHETLYQRASDGRTFPEVLKDRGILVGIKVDTGLKPLEDYPRETHTSGLDGLRERCEKYYEVGARFAKWRAALRIEEGEGSPSKKAIEINASELASYARCAVDSGLVPIVEPEILVDGTHSASVAAKIARAVIPACYEALRKENVPLAATLLKPMMITPGIKHPNREKEAQPEAVARATLDVMRDVVPSDVPGIMFLSGGMGEEEATRCLNALNCLAQSEQKHDDKDDGVPWNLSFSFGRALQTSPLQTWKGKDENVEKAKNLAVALAKANSAAQLGKFRGSHPSLTADNTLYEGYRGWRCDVDVQRM